MMKPLVAAAAGAMLCTPEAAGQTIVQKSDWQPRSFEAYLLPSTPGVPWLDLDVRTRLPKRGLPIGWQVDTPSSFVLHPMPIDSQVSSIIASDVRRM